MQPAVIALSILSADLPARRGSRQRATRARTGHFDVMDNHYVPNLTIGPVESARGHG